MQLCKCVALPFIKYKIWVKDFNFCIEIHENSIEYQGGTILQVFFCWKSKNSPSHSTTCTTLHVALEGFGLRTWIKVDSLVRRGKAGLHIQEDTSQDALPEKTYDETTMKTFGLWQYVLLMLLSVLLLFK